MHYIITEIANTLPLAAEHVWTNTINVGALIPSKHKLQHRLLYLPSLTCCPRLTLTSVWVMQAPPHILVGYSTQQHRMFHRRMRCC